jgi:hypothetical protein
MKKGDVIHGCLILCEILLCIVDELGEVLGEGLFYKK